MLKSLSPQNSKVSEGKHWALLPRRPTRKCFRNLSLGPAKERPTRRWDTLRNRSRSCGDGLDAWFKITTRSTRHWRYRRCWPRKGRVATAR